MNTDIEAAVAAAFREEWGQIVATLIRMTGDWDLAEECAQDAFGLALERWPRDGIPRRSGAWLTTTARHRATDRLRREAVARAKLREVASMTPAGPDDADDEAATSGVRDDLLRLMFTCCHPALAFDAQVALALRTLAGLTTAEIARAFLVPEATMSKRLVRAKQKITGAVPYRIPPAHLLPERMTAVLGVLYLLFNEGYSASAGADLIRQGLTGEAIRLARLLAELMPDEPEAGGLLALLLLHDARRTTRVDGADDLVTLEHQDRGRWGRRPDRRGRSPARGRPAPRAARPLSSAGRHRRLPRHGRRRLGGGRRSAQRVHRRPLVGAARLGAGRRRSDLPRRRALRAPDGTVRVRRRDLHPADRAEHAG